MQLVGSFAQPAFSPIPLPNFQLHGSWNDPSPLRIQVSWLCKVLFAFNGDEFELKDSSMPIVFSPRVHKMEDPIV